MSRLKEIGEMKIPPFICSSYLFFIKARWGEMFQFLRFRVSYFKEKFFKLNYNSLVKSVLIGKTHIAITLSFKPDDYFRNKSCNSLTLSSFLILELFSVKF